MTLPADLALGDIIDETWVDAVTAMGILVATVGAGAPAGTGSAGQWYYDTTTTRVWRSDGTAWRFVTALNPAFRPGVILTDAAQTYATGTLGDITWGTEVADVDGWHAAGSATLTVPAGWAGRYLISVTGSWSNSAGTTQGAQLLLNGTSVATYNEIGLWNCITIAAVLTLVPGDTLKVSAIHTGGVNRDLTSRIHIAWLES